MSLDYNVCCSSQWSRKVIPFPQGRPGAERIQGTLLVVSRKRDTLDLNKLTTLEPLCWPNISPYSPLFVEMHHNITYPTSFHSRAEDSLADVQHFFRYTRCLVSSCCYG